MPKCALCGTSRHRLYVAQEAGVEVGTGKPVAPGMVVCMQHHAKTEAGEYVRVQELGADFQAEARRNAVLK